MDFSKFNNRFKWLLMTYVYEGEAQQKIWAEFLDIDPTVLSRFLNMDNYGMEIPRFLKALKQLEDILTPAVTHWLMTGKGLDPMKLPFSVEGRSGGDKIAVHKRRS